MLASSDRTAESSGNNDLCIGEEDACGLCLRLEGLTEGAKVTHRGAHL